MTLSGEGSVLLELSGTNQRKPSGMQEAVKNTSKKREFPRSVKRTIWVRDLARFLAGTGAHVHVNTLHGLPQIRNYKRVPLQLRRSRQVQIRAGYVGCNYETRAGHKPSMRLPE
jgi:hypothetical protein